MSNYTDELAEWVSQRKAKKSMHATAMASFLAVSDGVREAMDDGFNLKTIWEYLREKNRISFRYETFLKYVNRHIKKNVKKVKNQAQGKTVNSAPSFSFSPNQKKDELL